MPPADTPIRILVNRSDLPRIIIFLIIAIIFPGNAGFAARETHYISDNSLKKYGVIFERETYSSHFIVIQGGKKFYFADGESVFVYNSRIYTLRSPPHVTPARIYLDADFVKNNLNVTRPSYKGDDPPPSDVNIPNKEKPSVALPETKNNYPDFIVIDPGHGGRDPGTLNKRYREKNITLATSRHLYKHLRKKFPQTRVYLTRHSDIFLNLEKRSDIANEIMRPGEMGIFISIHCNASFVSRVNGFEVFYLDSNPSNDEAREVSLRENGIADGPGYAKKLESVLINTQIQAESKMLARQINRSLLASMRGTTVGRGVRKADFSVLRGALMPSVLLEIGYLSNPREAAAMNQENYWQKISVGVENGIKAFVRNRPGME